MKIAVALMDHGRTIAMRTTSQSANRLKGASSRRALGDNAVISYDPVRILFNHNCSKRPHHVMPFASGLIADLISIKARSENATEPFSSLRNQVQDSDATESYPYSDC